MGWASGSYLAEKLWAVVRDEIPSNRKHAVANAIVELFEDADCDTVYEAEDLWRAAGRASTEEE